MYELKSFSESEKQNMAKLYRKLMQYERESLILDVEPDEKFEVNYINEIWKNWNNYKSELLKISKKMKSSWNVEEKEEKDNYFG